MVLVWQWTPFMMLIMLAGLQSQPTDILEAARVDGARPLAIFRELTLPHLRRYIELGIVLGSIYLVQVFDPIVHDDRRRARHSTPTCPTSSTSARSGGFDFGQAAAIGVVVVSPRSSSRPSPCA